MKDIAAICVVSLLLEMEKKCNELMVKKFGQLVDFEAVQTHSGSIHTDELQVQIMEKEYMHSQELNRWEVRSRKRRKVCMLGWFVRFHCPGAEYLH